MEAVGSWFISLLPMYENAMYAIYSVSPLKVYVVVESKVINMVT